MASLSKPAGRYTAVQIADLLTQVDGLGALAGGSPLALRFLFTAFRDPLLHRAADLRRYRGVRALLNPSQGFELRGLNEHLKSRLG